MSETKSASTMRSLERAIDVLEVLESSREPLRLSDVARRAGLHVATTQRILGVLEARERVEQSGSGYRIGVAMLFGAHAYLATNPIALAAPLVLQQLAKATGLTASAFVRAGDSRAVIARVEGEDPLRYVLPVGERLPLHLGAGKVLAAHIPWTELATILPGDPIIRADGQRVTLRELQAELTAIRQQGFAESHDERVVGAASVSAPVLTVDGECVAALQVAGPTSNAAFRDPTALGVEVRQAANALSSRLN
jgi:DNA-binding IclR family transcriptional regulator